MKELTQTKSELIKITIITVTLNAEEIDKTIESVLSQDYENIEYIVKDGGSKDSCIKKLDKYRDKINYFLSEKDNGIYDAMNRALEFASGDFVFFLNAGDLFYSTSTIKEVVSKITKLDALYYGDVLFSDKGKIKERFGGSFNRYRFFYENICHQSIFYPRNQICSMKFNLHYRLWADYYLNIEMLGNRIPFIYLDQIISIYDINGISSNNIDKHFIKDKNKIFISKFGLLSFLHDKIKRFISKNNERFCKVL